MDQARLNILFASTIEPADRWLPLLEKALPQDKLFTEPRADIDVALVATPPAGTFDELKRLKLIQSLWMGVERLLDDPIVPRNVPLARLVDPGMVAAMCETVLHDVLDWHLHFYRYREYQSRKHWHRHGQYMASDRTVGILGLGELGSQAAQRLRALDFNVVGWSRRPKKLPGVKSYTELEPMLRETDALVCLLPLTAETKGVVNKRTLGLMRKGGCVINVARGPEVVTEDLVAALDSGHLAHAYLDVFDREPLPADSPLWTHPKISITPHSAALTEPRTAVAKIADNINRLRRGEPLHNLVDRQAGY